MVGERAIIEEETIPLERAIMLEKTNLQERKKQGREEP